MSHREWQDREREFRIMLEPNRLVAVHGRMVNPEPRTIATSGGPTGFSREVTVQRFRRRRLRLNEFE